MFLNIYICVCTPITSSIISPHYYNQKILDQFIVDFSSIDKAMSVCVRTDKILIYYWSYDSSFWLWAIKKPRSF